MSAVLPHAGPARSQGAMSAALISGPLATLRPRLYRLKVRKSYVSSIIEHSTRATCDDDEGEEHYG